MRGLAVAAVLTLLAGCQTTGQNGGQDGPQVAAAAQPLPDRLDWQMTSDGPCVVSPPAVSFVEAEQCTPPTGLPGFPFFAVPYVGTLIGLGQSAADLDYLSCHGEASGALLHNRQAAYLLAQQCMDSADIAAMQGGLRQLGLLDRAAQGRIDGPTRAAMSRWHGEVYSGPMDLGPTKEFGARVVASAQPQTGWAGLN